ncbi:hypothetical protein [Humibacillus sp. DSM 29435]|nr:hypothetical protein [Humibacillus sp. DSM 29435]
MAYGIDTDSTPAAISTLEVELTNAVSLDSRVVPPPPSATAPQGGS